MSLNFFIIIVIIKKKKKKTTLIFRQAVEGLKSLSTLNFVTSKIKLLLHQTQNHKLPSAWLPRERKRNRKKKLALYYSTGARYVSIQRQSGNLVSGSHVITKADSPG